MSTLYRRVWGAGGGHLLQAAARLAPLDLGVVAAVLSSVGI
jgi:hypothetical protein